MKIREKLLDLKRRLQDRKMYSIVIVVIAAISVWGIGQYKHAASLRQQLDNQYNRAFYDMQGYVDNVQALLFKSLVSSSTARTALTLQEAWRQSNLAQTNLGQLPVSSQVLAGTSKFLTQVGDLAFSLNSQNVNGKALDGEQFKVVEKLYRYAVNLAKSLDELQNQLSSGRLKWGDLAKKGTPLFGKASKEMPPQEFVNVDKTFQDYPRLIYDGPFSDHMTNVKPRGVTGEEISSEEGAKRVKKFFGEDKVEAVTADGEGDGGELKTLNYKVTFKGKPKEESADIYITKKGGLPYQMNYNRLVAEKKLDMAKVKEVGRKFLEERGFPDMADTYYIGDDNTAVVNYAYKQGNVIIYSDLIKLKIALDDGSINGFEGKGYLYSHTERDIPAPGITMEDARKIVNPNVKILSSGLAIIPTEYMSEVFCYEFKGKYLDQDFLIYVNAASGKVEKILLIINTPDGTLTL
ncbi:MAG: germination protein YpeB [Clostridiales bacterium]|nr:germination protein YpeB [Clostridiales bacterium]